MSQGSSDTETSEVTLPLSSVQALLAELIDYAGLFPPAALDMETTVSNFARYVVDDDSWMLGRLIVPVARLDEFESAAGEIPARDEQPLWRISALPAPAGDDKLEGDLTRIARFNEQHGEDGVGNAIIDVIELKAIGIAEIERALDLIPDDLFPFFEIPIADDPRGLIAALAGSDAGAKVRTGGLTADLYPSADHLARFIAGCAAADVPFKATAGLHHPLRHDALDAPAAEFGFLGVFLAAAANHRREVEHAEMVDLLENRDADAFEFDEGGVRWRDRHISVDRIEAAREKLAISFGSCSFDEPREDLRALGLLPSR